MKFIDYIGEKRHGKEANKLERDAMTDPFLQDAIDGYDSMEGDYIADIEVLEKRLQQRMQPSNRFSQNRRRNWSIAAVVALLMIGIGSLIYFNLPKNDATTILTETETRLQRTDTHDSLWLAGEDQISKNIYLEEPQPVILQENLLAVSDNDILEEDIVSVAPESMEAPSAVMTETLAFEGVKKESKKDFAFERMEKTRSKEQKKSDKPESQGNLSGVVKDRETGEPIPFVNVTLISKNDTMATTAANIDGSYKIQRIASEKYNARFSCVGYQTVEVQDIVIGADKTVLKDVILQPTTMVLNAVEIVANSVPVFESVQTSSSSVVMADEIRKMPNRSQNEFGEKEFSKYFEKNISKDICDGRKITAQVSFYLPETGIPEKIEVEKTDCEELREAIIELLKTSPQWTETQRNAKMTLKVRQ